MFGIITTLFTLQGIGLGAYAAGAGAKSLWKRITENQSSDLERFPVGKHLYKNWLIQVEDASYSKSIEIYFTYVNCGLVNRKVYIEAKSKEELDRRIKDAVAELSAEVDAYNRRARGKA